MKELDLAQLTTEWKNCLNLIQRNDVFNFPKSCDAITIQMAEFIKSNSMLDDYNVFYIRGHYLKYPDNVECFDYHEEERIQLREGIIAGQKNECMNCTCSDVEQHSFLELVSKESDTTMVLDFSSYQFHDNFYDLYDTCYTIEQLMEVHPFLIEKSSSEFNRYLPSQKIVCIKEMDTKIKWLY